MDDFGVARAGVRSDRVLGFKYHDVATRQREFARYGESHHAGADDGAINLFGHLSCLLIRVVDSRCLTVP